MYGWVCIDPLLYARSNGLEDIIFDMTRTSDLLTIILGVDNDA